MFPENKGGRIGTYFHLFPTYAQAKKVIWDAHDRDGFKVTDHFPKELVASKNESELQITLTNGSIYQLIGTDKIDSIVGTNPVGCVFSEYALQNPRAWDLLSPILLENDGWGIFNYTPRGHNHGKDLFEMALGNPRWYCSLLTVNDTFREDGSRVISDDAIAEERARGMHEELIQQEYYCSFEGYQEGSYYAEELRKARKECRITVVTHEKYYPVYTFWDLGIGDSTCIWFAQYINGQRRYIDYYENNGQSMSFYGKVLQEKPYNYARHYMPHDADARELGTGKSLREVAEAVGIRPVHVLERLTVDIGINAVRMMFPNSWFDEEKCRQGLNALANYHKEYDDDRKEFKPKPFHDWSSHGADAFRTASMSDFDRARAFGPHQGNVKPAVKRSYSIFGGANG
jgi:hypothetical protein